MLLLFRFLELSGGSIELDGINIANVHLKRLRASISMLPQGMSGTLSYASFKHKDCVCRTSSGALFDMHQWPIRLRVKVLWCLYSKESYYG
eukprot:SAG11_NODE_274_length_11310_cov_4.717510_6_plen_91_part_00